MQHAAVLNSIKCSWETGVNVSGVWAETSEVVCLVYGKKKQQNTCEEEAADIVFMIKSRVEHVSESKINFTKAFYSYSCKSTRK